ncbi:MAG: hypothetical protein CMO80_15360 [Verrucomicrobiales bacterium]|nr:hypothetical protein [Verrucomicrobiales bacterium]|tara:strand:+ start:227 stop:886 length:660 start_codon:yes stop_codon:yes gene_type:complete
MTELFQESIRVINFPLSLLMIVIIIYWLLALVGFLDFDILDGSADLHVDGGDVHVEGDLQADFDGSHGGGILGGISSYLHVGDAPLTVILSVMIIFMWSFSLLLNHYFNSDDSFFLGLLFLVPNIIVSVLLSGIIIIPVAVFFKKLSGSENVKKNALGDMCTVISQTVDYDSGQAEVAQEGAPIVVNARTSNPNEVLTRGQKAVVVRKNDNGTYVIKSI